MNGRIRACRAAALALLFLLAAPVPGRAVDSTKPAASSVEDAIRALEAARGRALLKADTTALAAMTGDDFVEISRLAQLRTKADNLREIATGSLKLSTVKYEDLVVRVYGDVAVLQGVADNTGTFRGMPFGGKLRYTRVFVRRDGRWQAVAMQHTMMPAP